MLFSLLSQEAMNILGSALSLVIITLGITSILKIRQIQRLNKTVAYLKKSLDELDEQAKLIVRTDLELNKTQEELDKKINGLYALQRISQDVSKTLDQNAIFQRISREHIQQIGFQKTLVFTKNQQGKLHIRHQVGFDEEQIQHIENKFTWAGIYDMLKEKSITLSSASPSQEMRQAIQSIAAATNLDSFIIAPLSKKEGLFGFILLAHASGETALTVTEGDEELVAILASQISQALENAELFEAAYSQHQELEIKVEERTKELSGALNEIKLVNQRKTDFVSAVSHELRTPLTSIKGYASILLAGKLGTVPEEVRQRLEKINIHSNELTHMVNNLLDIARIESGKIALKLEPLDILSSAAYALDLLSPQVKEKSIQARIDIPQGLSPALGDQSQISRVFINLIGNAIKFVPAEGGCISINAFESGQVIQVNVADNGIGMSQNDTEHIFDEFYRADNAINQKVKGTGLGLTLVKNIIQAHQGKIWVESKLNQGSTFSFTLPRCKT
jgi:signal transduction histidine kinase